MAKKLRIDWFLFAITVGLALFGIVMVYSASAMISLKETGGQTQYFYFYKQFGFTLIGLGVMYLTSKIHYKLYQRKWITYGFLILTLTLLMAVFAFPAINGAQRWIRFQGLSFQPSEFAKVALSIFMAYFLIKNEDSIGSFRKTFLPCTMILALLGGAIFIEPDLGTLVVICAIFVSVYFSAGARFLHLGASIAILFAIGTASLIFAPWRVRRLAAFLEPCGDENKLDAGYQVCQSLMGIGSGGVLGEGFARGQQKLFYLPHPHSDFIFTIIGEELGLVGTLAVVLAFGLLLWRGTRAALLAPDRFGMLLGIGITTSIIVQALFHISVAVSILPAKGITLPLISYGGSSIIVTFFAIGILLNISRYAGFVSDENDFMRYRY